MKTTEERQYKTFGAFDHKHAELSCLPDTAKTKATNHTHMEPVVGTQTYIVQTFRQRGEPGDGDKATPSKDWIFLQFIADGQSFRIYLPPEVANIIARQRDALTGKMRRHAAREEAKRRKALGIVPGFMKGGRKGKAARPAQAQAESEGAA
jgi:hypothetical protein